MRINRPITSGRGFQDGVPTGRFCNGRLPTDFISEVIGLPPVVPEYLDPAYNIEDFAKGVSFASAGTGLDNATSDVLVSCFVDNSLLMIFYDESTIKLWVYIYFGFLF
jgi:hypothetical protein